MDSLIYGLVFLPVAGAAVSFTIGKKYKKYRDYFVGTAAVLEFVLAGFLLYRYDRCVIYGSHRTFRRVRHGAYLYGGWIQNGLCLYCGVYVDVHFIVFRGIFCALQEQKPLLYVSADHAGGDRSDLSVGGSVYDFCIF